MSDAELIERARESVSRLMNYGECHDGDVDGAACLLEQLADRLAALTTPEPWQTSTPPLSGLQFVRIHSADGSRRVAEGWYCHEAGWRTARSNRPLLLSGELVTGWREIVRPSP